MAQHLGEHPHYVGFIMAMPSGARRWHDDYDCPALGTRDRWTVSADAVLTVAHVQATHGRLPCRRCALAVVLDALVATCSGLGYSVVSCAVVHCRAGTCVWCAALTSYAASRQVLAASAGRVDARAWLLLPGVLDLPPALAAGLRLDVRRAQGSALPAMTPDSWASAATLVAAGAPVGQALVVAAALHAAPTS